jgi:hypothetical protein
VFAHALHGQRGDFVLRRDIGTIRSIIDKLTFFGVPERWWDHALLSDDNLSSFVFCSVPWQQGM